MIPLRNYVLGIFVVCKSFRKRGKKRKEPFNAALSITCQSSFFNLTHYADWGIIIKYIFAQA